MINNDEVRAMTEEDPDDNATADTSEEKRVRERRNRLPATYIVDFCALRPGQTFVDIGCGTGYFTLEAARALGPKGMVYAVDNKEDRLITLKERLVAEGITWVYPLLTDALSMHGIPDRSADAALLAYVLHEIHDMNRAPLIKEIGRILKPGGILTVIEWEYKKMPSGPPIHRRMPVDKVIEFLNRLGFTMLQAQTLQQGHMIYTAQKQK